MQVWVIDTSSIIRIREIIPNAVRKNVMDDLGDLVVADVLFYPPEVVDELERWTAAPAKGGKRPVDPLAAWAKKHKEKACRHGSLYPEAQRVLRRVRTLIDPMKVSVGGLDDADPYVIALGLLLKDSWGKEATVITDDFKTVVNKTSLSDAAGLLKLPSLTLRTFLIGEGFWDGK